MKRVMITGGAGYVGTLLTNQLLAKGYEIVVYDTMYYGCKLADHERLTLVEGDIRDIEHYTKALQGCDTVIHLACISNDPSFHLNESLSTTINYDAFEPLVVASKEAGVSRFIYASSSSVYGVSDQPNVTEEHPLLPLTLYNKFKGLCEPLLFKHQSDDFVCVTIRPATVCGFSPRMRLDLSVNILTASAINNGKITVFGGEQLRPNLHIQDMCNLYELLLEIEDEKIQGQTFNAGYQNLSIAKIAQIVRSIVMEEFPEHGEVTIETTASDDKRSYHICSDKIKKHLGFEATHTIEDAARDICIAFKNGLLPDTLSDTSYSNVKTLQEKEIV